MRRKVYFRSNGAEFLKLYKGSGPKISYESLEIIQKVLGGIKNNSQIPCNVYQGSRLTDILKKYLLKKDKVKATRNEQKKRSSESISNQKNSLRANKAARTQQMFR